MIILGCGQSTMTVSLLVFQMYKGLLSCSSSLSKSTLEKHKSSLKSLVGQFMTTPIAILPAMLIVLTIVFPFSGAQSELDNLMKRSRKIADFTRYMLMIMSTHSAVNCLVVIFTFPEFRNFVFFWRKKGVTIGQRPPVSIASSGLARPVRNSWTNSVS
ncbi:hypothetical protein B9Z55_020053 [Caenorhabditis nigoni]|nr:hypothetical protein B9Z55_020053 [Caenorhabditis nigoni]